MATQSTATTAGILARGVTKRFVTNKPADPGFRGALRALIRPEKISRTAIERIDLAIDPGELVLLLGPNGAGKSTLIKVLTGVIRPTSGDVRVAGVVPRANQRAHARNIGVVFGQRSQLWWDLPVRQSYLILQNIYDLTPATAERRLAEFDEILGLSEFWDTRLRHLSLGQRVRADLAAALLHDPAVIFLDEPTIGMDVVAKDQVRRFLRRQVDGHGRCVLLTTHDMNEVKRLGGRVVVINHGHIVSDGDIGELTRRFGAGFRITVTLRRASAPVEVPGLQVVEREGPLVTLAPHPSPDEPPLIAHDALARVVHDLEVEGIAVEEDDLEDVLRSAFQSTRRAQPAADEPEARIATGPAAVRRGWAIGGVTALTEGSSRGRIWSTAFEIALPLYLTVLLWRGLYADQQQVAGVTQEQAVTYAVIAALLTYLRVGNRAWVRDATVQHIRSGTIVYWFLWPLRPAVYHALRGAGDLAYALLWAIPAYLICMLTGAIVGPVDGTAALAGAVSFLLGQVIFYLIGLLLDLVCFWTLVNEQIQQMVSFVQALLSGGFAPLWFFPEWFQILSLALPFHCIVNVPMSIYVGQATGAVVVLQLLQQLAWCLVLTLIALTLWWRAAARLEVQGG